MSEITEGPAEETVPNRVPVPKIQAAGLGGAVSLVLVWLLGLFGVEVPPTVAAAFTTILAGLFGYVKSP